MAVDKQFQGKGIGAHLLVYFLVSLVQVARKVGIHALVLEPLNERVRGYYERFGLLPLPEDPTRMYARVRDIEAWLLDHGNGNLVDR
jgi:GNAT superfamily N-acetyltransferase